MAHKLASKSGVSAE